MRPQDAADEASTVDGPSDEIRDAIRDAVKADLKPVRALSIQVRALLALAIAVLASIVGFALFGGPSDASSSAPLRVGLVVVALSVVAMVVAFTPRATGQANRSLKMASTAAVLLGWTAYLALHCESGRLACALEGPALVCAIRGLLIGLAGGGALFWLWRKTDPWTPRLSGALVGGASGAIAAATVSMMCGGVSAGHLAVGHWLVVPILAIMGALTARRVLAP
jgi:hypothetical protein